MKELLDLHGIITVLNTPFKDDDTIDVAGLRKNVVCAIKAGVAGFLVPAMAAEVGKLTEAERELMVCTVIETLRSTLLKTGVSRPVVIGGASASTTEARIHATRRLIDLGCDGILVSIPYEDETQYESAVQAVADQHPPLLMLQDWDAAGYGVPIPVIVRLFDTIPCFRCLKVEVVPAGVKYSAVLKATDGRLHVSGGWAVMQMIEALDRGVHAFMPTGMHEIYTKIFALYATNRRDEACALFHRLAPILAFSNQHLDISIHFFKHLLHRQGIYATPLVRQPILPFDEYHEKTAEELIARVMHMIENIQSPE